MSHFLHQISQDNFTVMPRKFYYATCFKQYTICHCDSLAQTICHWYVSCIYNYTLVPRQLYTGTQTIIHCCLDNFPVLIIQPRQFSILDNFTTLRIMFPKTGPIKSFILCLFICFFFVHIVTHKTIVAHIPDHSLEKNSISTLIFENIMIKSYCRWPTKGYL